MGRMQKGSIILVALSGVATVLINVAAFSWRDVTGLGVMIGQVILVTAAAVLLRQRLSFRLPVLGLALASAIAWALSSTPLRPMEAVLLFVSVMMVSAAWAGGLRFFGWLVVSTSDDLPVLEESPRQFSLATILGATALIAVFLGLISNVQLSDFNRLVIILCALLAIPGCSLLTMSVRSGWGLFIGAVVVPVAYFVLFVFGEHILQGDLVDAAILVLTCELCCVATVVVALRFAGIRLALSCSSRRPVSQFTLSRAPQSLA